VVKRISTGHFFAGEQGGQRLGGLRSGWSVGRADFGWKFGCAPPQLVSDFKGAHAVAAE